jgi:hypothetical protein
VTNDEALAIAKDTARQNGWPWQLPIYVKRRRRIFRSAVWSVVTNVDKRGCNVRANVDDRDGRVLQANFCPR